MENKQHVHPTGLALGATAGIIYTLCALFVAILPGQAVGLFRYWFHGIDLTKIAVVPQITLGNFLTGLVCVMLFFYLVGILYAFLYNLCVKHCRNWGWI